MYDKTATIEILGCLIKKPDIILDENYKITNDDFTEKFHKICFSAINNLIINGVKKIDAIIIDSFLSKYDKQYKIFCDNKGFDYIEKIVEVSSLENFDFNYKNLKKYSVLRDICKTGFDISYYYDSDILDLSLQEEIQKRFNESSVEDIIDYYDKKILDIKTTHYNEEGQIGHQAAKGMKDLKEDLKKVPEMGIPVNGHLYNTIIRGARLKKLYMRSSDSGGGKAIPNYTLIPTPNGFRKVGDIRSGDTLFGQDGKPTKVIQIHPQKEEKEIYEVHFKDGRVAECCGEHLWEYSVEGETKVENTASILKKAENGFKDKNENYRFKIPLNEAVEFLKEESGTTDYFLGSKNQRMEILNSLINTNKKIDKKTINLCNSLGMVVESSENSYKIIKNENKLAITNIIKTSKKTKMTCFTVDNESHLFLINDYIVTHNTRYSVGDACLSSVGTLYDSESKKWTEYDLKEPTLFISTELTPDEIQTMMMAFISDINEDKILNGDYTKEEEIRIDKAIQLIEEAPLWIEQIPNFNIEDIERTIKKYKLEHSIGYVYFDYVFVSVKMLTEIAQKTKGMRLREDNVLYIFIERMKFLCNSLNIHFSTSSQLNGEWENAKNKNQNLLRGAKSMADKLDVGTIVLEPTKKDLESVEHILHNGFYKTPNRVYHVYKVRRGKLNKIMIWTYADLGTCRSYDQFITNKDYELIDIETISIDSILKSTEDLDLRAEVDEDNFDF